MRKFSFQFLASLLFEFRVCSIIPASMIPDEKKWNLGITKLGGFMKHVQSPFDEDVVADLHGIKYRRKTGRYLTRAVACAQSGIGSLSPAVLRVC